MMQNGQPWLDTTGQPIHAHGGCILKYQDWYYWYGEDRRADYYVSCYRSQDLMHWEFRNHILTTTSPFKAERFQATAGLVNSDGTKVNIERPKVLYNPKTERFVLWAHFENGRDYREAAVLVASAATPDGDFTEHGHFRPFGNMSRDCTVFVDADQAYFISAARGNADIHIYQLSSDYLNVTRLVNRLWSNEFREAPVLFKHDGLYYMLTSGTSGWRPNQGKYAVASAIAGSWSDLQDFGDATTFDSQPAFVLKNGNQVIYVGDRWGGAKHYQDSSYVFLPLEITSQQVILKHKARWFIAAHNFVFKD
ncbi:coagulation factor 5 8 type domain protein [Agrilactobacillus composti DSM 18527 = JCM 14202]|uniref:Coagulation factor 5 8 type domain protein n=1 Tax=Agrilactobacillus composti DSM 18527 = JCM 14202 TaxID=1423734 RepID=X0PD57_9LACO|nr:family 43 glycosylhydrolase [Agrilactobacillus composti]KRM34845.1 coagulation factor 5 8 type domain protein [Agrilactobacillus composti DSM 18527 = JCM 14202]GAF38703.1 hypothetical protein JCM14202_527 [Agrilactobacillus composti DSM 18527 = JCM 14202]